MFVYLFIYIFRGTFDEKIHFIFNMYNVSHDNKVSKQELATLLNQGRFVKSHQINLITTFL